MRTSAIFIVVSVLGLVSFASAAEPFLIGDFESGPDTGYTPWRYDHWYDDGLAMLDVTSPIAAVTRGSHALKCTTTAGGWGPGIQLPLFDWGSDYAANPAIQAILGPEAVVAVDATVFAADVAGGWCQIGFTHNTAAPSGGWNKYMWQNMILDGQPHRYIFTIDEETRNAILNAKGGWGANIGLCLNMASGSGTVYFDNIWIYPEGPVDEFGPHSPAVTQEADMVNGVTNVMLYWKAADDPNRHSPYNVHPDIVNQYVFMSKTQDPNLYYIGATGFDPGDNPDSQYGPVTGLSFETTYYWAVVEALDGYEQTLIPGVSRIEDADPNNIIGPVWKFTTLSTAPQIIQQPVSTRAPLGQPLTPAFTIQVASVTPEYYQWYSSPDAIIDSSDNAISGAVSNYLNLPALAAGYQRYYYCKVTNSSSEVVYSNVVTLVVERMLAHYRFENNLNDTGPVSTDLHHGTGVNSPVFVNDAVEGSYALSLNGLNQYVTLGTAAYPKASLLAADGIGGGLDTGSILCWIKAAQGGAILANYNDGTTAGFDLTIAGDARILVRGNSGAPSAAAKTLGIIGDGKWHLLAATWQANGQMRMYVDNTEAAAAYMPNAGFSPWQYAVLVGANRTSDADRSIIGNYFGGLIDNLRIYNYVITPEAIAEEYYSLTGLSTCLNPNFEGSQFNMDNTGSSYCRVDLADFAAMAQNWLASGFYPVP